AGPARAVSGQNAPCQRFPGRSFRTGVGTRHGTCHLRVTRSGVNIAPGRAMSQPNCPGVFPPYSSRAFFALRSKENRRRSKGSTAAAGQALAVGQGTSALWAQPRFRYLVRLSIGVAAPREAPWSTLALRGYRSHRGCLSWYMHVARRGNPSDKPRREECERFWYRYQTYSSG